MHTGANEQKTSPKDTQTPEEGLAAEHRDFFMVMKQAVTFNARDCSQPHRTKPLPGEGTMRLPSPVHAARLVPGRGVGWLVLRVRSPQPGARAQMGLFLSTQLINVLVPGSLWIQPDSLRVTFRASCLPPPTYTGACQVIPGVHLSAPGHSPHPAHFSQGESTPLPGAPLWHPGPGTLSYPSLIPAPTPRPHKKAVCGACFPWKGLCSWRLVAGPGGGGIFPVPPRLTFNYAVCPAPQTINFHLTATTHQLMEGLLQA